MSTRARVSRLAYFYWRDAQLICDLPHHHWQIALTAATEPILRLFADWAPLESAAALSGGAGLADQMLGAGVLVAEQSPDDEFETNLGPWARMGPAARYFHLASRTHGDARYLTAAEDTAALVDKARHTPPPPAYREYPEASQIPLPCPDLTLPEANLAEVLLRRRTTRELDPHTPLPAEALGTLLRWAAGPVHTVDVSWLGPVPLKTSPSAGARHPIEVYPVVRNVDGISRASTTTTRPDTPSRT